MKTKSRKSTAVSRRKLLVSGAAAGGGLALGLHLPGLTGALAQKVLGTEGNEVGAWVFIRPNDDVVIRIARTEMGQGTLTGLAQLVAEELECDWKKVKTEMPTPGQNLARNRIWRDMPTLLCEKVGERRKRLALPKPGIGTIAPAFNSGTHPRLGGLRRKAPLFAEGIAEIGLGGCDALRACSPLPCRRRRTSSPFPASTRPCPCRPATAS